ncbi:hypothetical protein M758_2G229000 [Ceratodon purpureus]|nr:hypothetical protein M758_2G229000 [Ceratodon purpureus]
MMVKLICTEMERFAGGLLVLALVLSPMIVVQAALPSDNVSVQWNVLLNKLFCTSSGLVHDPIIILANLNLAQWHGLLALKGTGACTKPEAVVAYASRKVLANYFVFDQNTLIDPLLANQLTALGLSETEKKLAKGLGEAVARRLISKSDPAYEFALPELRSAINANQAHPTPGLLRFLSNDTVFGPNALFVTHAIAFDSPYVIPYPNRFIEEYLGDLKPMAVPSDAWDKQYNLLKDVGRINWSGRTYEMNYTASLYLCPRQNTTYCLFIESFWTVAAMNILPKETSLDDIVEVFAKLSVALHDALVVVAAQKDGYWFWRPQMAFTAGDPRHPPIPDWLPYGRVIFTGEYPSGTTMSYAAAATVLQDYFGKKKVPFTVDGGGVFGGATCYLAGTPVKPRHFDSLWAAVEEAKRGRMYVGAHYKFSVDDGAEAGKRVAQYILKHWGDRPPQGVLPDTEYLKVHANLPKKSGDWDPLRFEY